MPTIRIEVSGQSFEAPLPDQPVHIGSAEDADLRLQCDGVAPLHCVLEPLLEPLLDGRHKVADAKSGRPTLVNGIAIKQVSLRDGDVLQVGEARIVYSTAGAPVAAAPPPVAAAAPARPAPARPAPARPAPAPAQAAPTAPLAAAPPAARPAARQIGSARSEGTSSRSGTAENKSKKTALFVLVGLVVLAGIALAVGGGLGSSDTDKGSLKQAYAEGQRLYEAKDYAGARQLWTPLAENRRAGTWRAKADDGLRLLGDVEREMDSSLQRLWSERLDRGAGGIATMRRSFLGTYGEGAAPRFDVMAVRVRAAQVTWKREQLERMAKEAGEFAASARFADAREAWRTFAHAAPAAIDVSAELKAAEAKLEIDAEARAQTIIARAEAWIAEETPYRSSKYLESVLPRFRGMRALAGLEAALKHARFEADKPMNFGPSKPGPKAEPGKPTPTPPQPPSNEAETKALAARAAALLATAGAEAKARRFGAAAKQLEDALADFPAGASKTKLSERAADFALAEDGLGRLIQHINAEPKRYAGLKLTDRLTVSLLEADRETLSAAVRGGRSKWRWERLGATAFQHMVVRLRAERDDALVAAALLHGVGLEEEAERMLYRANRTGLATTVIFPVLARWRGQPVPEGGYVVHRDRYVTPAERVVLIREARVRAALKQVDARSAEVRRAAYDELLSIGEPAAKRFREALDRRRAYIADQLANAKSATSGKYKAKLLGLLEQRRAKALALIYDAQAYPYPNPNKKNQKEVEALVDLVRQVWETPFDLVAQWDKALKERLDTVTEVDEYLSRLDGGYTPDLDQIRERINKAIDVPAAADPSKREYSLQVLAYNDTLPDSATTATGQEQDNVRAVNEYRMMMGLLAVKINERLTRAARGHSRHMLKNKYFAHNVPGAYATPQNRSPGARAKRQGFGGGVGENIARGPGTGRGAFMAWFRSSGHHRNMLGRGWLQMGCGRAGGTWWTQLFASGSKSLKVPEALPAPEAPFAPDAEQENGRLAPSGPAEVPDEPPPGDGGEAPEDGPDDEP